MSILHGGVYGSRGVEAEAYQEKKKNQVRPIVEQIVNDIDLTVNERRSWTTQGFLICYIVNHRTLFLCICDGTFALRIAFSFLDKIQGDWKAGDAKSFNARLFKEMDFFSNDPSSDKVRSLSSNLESVKNIMKDNIGKMLARGEAIETVLDKTETLKDSSDRFKSSATRLKRRMWWKNVKLWCVIIIVILIIILVITLVACGGFTFDRCRPKSDNQSS
eukprot:TRINITY_DN19848_c0_g1_i1.p1 TRINITY_DN19848_c0_g1~~TRINITY_DN19848_c0_g1_i1.p1  ORF type:complete len:218 (-),score=32.39 TRINITY_DN19848_c0_g1_i1:38-691(-)